MSEPSQRPVPPSAQPSPADPAATPLPPAPPHLPAAPQYPSGTPNLPTVQEPAAPAAFAGYAAPAYPPQGHPTRPGTPAYAAAPHAADTGNPLGRVAFLLAVIPFAVNLTLSLAAPFAYFAADGFGWFNAVSGFVAVLSFVAYVTAFVIGLVALRRPAPHALAGIAIGIAGVGAIGIATAWVSSLFYQFL